MTRTGWAQADSLDEVIARMDAIDAALPADDGVATFNRMYRKVTQLVVRAVDDGRFGEGPFLERLDVHFGNLFFEAYAADLGGHAVNRAWAPLFEHRRRPDTHPVQFALAGMNAHICHDLPSAVVMTCRELAISPEDGSREHRDFCTTNDVLAEAFDEIKTWFSTGTVARMDTLGGQLDDRLAMFGIHLLRAAAWEVGQTLWRLADNPRSDRVFRTNLGHGVGLASRGLLL